MAGVHCYTTSPARHSTLRDDGRNSTARRSQCEDHFVHRSSDGGGAAVALNGLC